jgi:hypothetical protein
MRKKEEGNRRYGKVGILLKGIRDGGSEIMR